MPDGTKTGGRFDLGKWTQSNDTGKQVVETISRRRNVIAVFYGDGHCNDINFLDGVVYCQTASLIEYPIQYRIVELSPGLLSTRTYPLSNSFFAQESLVKDRENDWVLGEETDRNFARSF
jgi:hypothetical protein